MTDVVTGDTNGNVTVFLNNGDGTFAPGVDYATGGGTVTGVAIADVNGDGNQDTIATTRGSPGSGIFIFLGLGTGGLQAPYAVLNYDGGSGDSPTALAVGTFFHDGRVALATGGSSSGANSDFVRVFWNDGTGHFTLADTIRIGNTYTSTSWLQTADLTGTGSSDIVASAGGNGVTGCGGVIPLINNGSGAFSDVGALPNICSAPKVATSDFNLDGHTDIAAADSCSDFCGTPAQVDRVYFGAGDGTFPTSEDNAVPAGNPGHTIAADLNGDGVPDLVVTCAASCTDSMQAVVNNGDGTFSNGPELSGDNLDLAAGPLTQSCFPDIASVGYDLSILINTQSGPCQGGGGGGGAGGGGAGGGGAGGGSSSQPCPFGHFPAQVGPDLSHKIFEKRLASYPSSSGINVTINGGFGLGTPTFCSLNTVLNHIYGATDRRTHARLAIFPVSLGAQSLAVTFPTTPLFEFDLDRLRFVNTDSPDWAAAPSNQPGLSFHWNNATIRSGGGNKVKVEVEQHAGDFAALPSLEVPLMSVSAFTLSEQLINELPTNRLYLALQLTPEGALSLTFSPAAVSLECRTEALGGVLIDLWRNTMRDAVSNALSAAARQALREFPGLGVSVSSLSRSFAFVNDIASTICGYAEADVQLAQARAYLLVTGLVLAPIGGEGADALVILLDNAIPRGLTLVPALAGAASATHSSSGPSLAAPVRLRILGVRTVRLARPGGLRPGPLPRSKLVASTRRVLAVNVAAHVNRLLVSTSKLRPGGEVTAVAARLVKRTRRAIVTLVGPGYRGVRVLRTHRGLAGGRIKLPRRMRPGRWTLGIVSYAGLHQRGHHVTGAADVRVAVFTVRSRRAHRVAGATGAAAGE